MIRLADPDISDADIAAVESVLRSGQLVQGKVVAEFEKRIAAVAQTKDAVALNNCTAALHLALLSLGVGAKDRVVVPTYSWPATANAIVLCGAEPVFVDVTPDTFNMDAVRLRSALEGQRVAAILPVHAFGGMADMRAICAVAADARIPVIEDAACALGATLGDRPAGAWGIAGCFSFHPRKAITTGEGGAVATNDGTIVCTVKSLRNHGQDPGAPRPDFVAAGFNLRMTEIQAALGLGQMERMGGIIARRQELAARYDSLLASAGVTLPHALAPGSHVYQSYVVLVPREASTRRDALIAEMRQRGVEVTIGTYHIPMTTYYRRTYGYAEGDYPVTDDIASRALALPLHSKLREGDVERVVSELVACL